MTLPRRLRWRAALLAVMGVVWLGASEDVAAASRIDVMTQNQYLGADLTLIAIAPNPPAFVAAAIATLARVADNDFSARAGALARLIASRRPHLVGLQEVSNFQVNFQNGPPPFRDHLADTLNALAALGQDYVVVASVQNLAVTLPPLLGIDADGDGNPDFISVIDRDVILARGDIAASVLPVPFSGVCALPSVDLGPGCNYQTFVVLPTPLGPIEVKRGFVGVDATIDGKDYRFVNTHLELRTPDPTNPLSPVIQAAQAAELIQFLGATTPATRSLIVVGDLNSSPGDPIIPGPLPLPPPFNQGIVPPYAQFIGSDYTDAWTLRPGGVDGFSCCQLDDLSNHKSISNERIDVIFSLEPPSKVKQARVLGDRVSDKTGPPPDLWPSDHASVAAGLEFD